MPNNENAELVVSPFHKKPRVSTFCRWDELTDVVACPGVILPSINEACHNDIGIFDEYDKDSKTDEGPIKVLTR